MLSVPAGNLSPGKNHRQSYKFLYCRPPKVFHSQFPSLLCPEVYSVFLTSTSYVHVGLGLEVVVKGVAFALSLSPCRAISQLLDLLPFLTATTSWIHWAIGSAPWHLPLRGRWFFLTLFFVSGVRVGGREVCGVVGEVIAKLHFWSS